MILGSTTKTFKNVDAQRKIRCSYKNVYCKYKRHHLSRFLISIVQLLHVGFGKIWPVFLMDLARKYKGDLAALVMFIPIINSSSYLVSSTSDFKHWKEELRFYEIPYFSTYSPLRISPPEDKPYRRTSEIQTKCRYTNNIQSI